jgi:hypothetical protein
MVVAQTAVNADYKDSSSQGFNRLASYIFGNNKSEQKNDYDSTCFSKTRSCNNGYDGASHPTKNPASLANGICATAKLHGIISPETVGFGCID